VAAISSQFTVSAVWDISRCNTPRRWATAPSQSRRGRDKETLARKLGASIYLDTTAVDPAKELAKRGGARAIIETVTSGKAMSKMVGGLAVDGKLVVIGVSSEPLEVPPFSLIAGRQSIQGWQAGTSIDAEDTLAFSMLTGVRSMNEVFPLERAPEAFERMMSGAARFRVVLEVARSNA
jgi:D-arabinose 1-dehydrogenase-like Zn-dependent alcohol dehydrogenase